MITGAISLIFIMSYVQPPLFPVHHSHSHSFLDNKAVATYCLAGMALDAYSTQKFLHERNRVKYVVWESGIPTIYTTVDPPPSEEANPLARPFVTKGWRGQILASGTGFGVTLLASYVFHKKGWHRFETMPFVAVGQGSFIAGGINLSTDLDTYHTVTEYKRPHHREIQIQREGP